MSLAMSSEPEAPYVVGSPHGNQRDHAAFEFKQAAPDNTGGGYPRWRSYEFRSETPGTEKEDVYVAVHRLCAVAWMFPDEWTAEDVLRSGQLLGADVHHELGMPAANLEGELSLRDHGEHSEITQTQRRAWAEDQKQAVEERERQPLGQTAEDGICARCGDPADPLAECDAWSGESRCLRCAKETSNGQEIRL